MNRFFIALLLISAVSIAQTEETGTKKDRKGNVFTDAGDIAKMALAKQKMYAGQFIGALNTYREVEKNEPNNGVVLYYISYCYLKVNKLEKAKEYALKAIAAPNVKPESHVVLGKIYQAEEDFDKAIAEFNLFIAAPSKDEENNEDANVLLSHCQNAKKMMLTPLDVTITNLGPNINSAYDDKNPCITADGSKLVITTRRPKTTDALMDVEGDGKYFEDIYISGKDSATHEFSKAVELSGPVNTKGHDACTGISPDGKQIFIYKNDAADKRSIGGEVYVTKVISGKWKTPEPIGKPIASLNWEGGACISPDGKKYFFFSERKGGMGRSDVYVVERKNKTEWGKPENLGPGVNTGFDEGAIFLAPDGKTLFFCSNGPASMGSYDIFKTVYSGGKWSAPVNLGYPINTSAKEGQITLSADAKFAYISSDRKGGLGESDIYKIDLKNYAILEADGKKNVNNDLSILKGTIRDGNEGSGLPEVDVVVTDEAGTQIASTVTSELGEYFLTLKSGNYVLTVKKKGFIDITEKIEMKKSEKETFSLEKGYLMKK